jgi:hypothetical protein
MEMSNQRRHWNRICENYDANKSVDVLTDRSHKCLQLTDCNQDINGGLDMSCLKFESPFCVQETVEITLENIQLMQASAEHWLLGVGLVL